MIYSDAAAAAADADADADDGDEYDDDAGLKCRSRRQTYSPPYLYHAFW